MDTNELEERIAKLEEKAVELEAAVRAILENMQKNVEITGAIHETFQNLNAYLMVNVGPPLFLDGSG